MSPESRLFGRPRLSAWAAVVLVSLVALGNARLLVRGVWERAAGASPAADVA